MDLRKMAQKTIEKSQKLRMSLDLLKKSGALQDAYRKAKIAFAQAPQDKEAQAYFCQAALHISACLKTDPSLYAGDPSGSLYHPETLFVQYLLSDADRFRSLSFECWGVKAEALQAPPAESSFEPFVLSRMKSGVLMQQRASRFLTDPDSLVKERSQPDLYWLCPARISGVLANGKPFRFEPADAFREELLMIKTRGLRIEVGDNRILSLAPKAPQP